MNESKYLLDPKYMTKRDLKHYYRYYNSTKNRKQCRKILLGVLLLCFFGYIFLSYYVKTSLNKIKDIFDSVPRVYTHFNQSQAYFVDTPGCQMPYFKVIDDNILQFVTKPKPSPKSCGKSLLRTGQSGSELWLNMNEDEMLEFYNITDVGTVECDYAEVTMKTDRKNNVGPVTTFVLHNQVGTVVAINQSYEFIRVRCFQLPERNRIYRDYHFFVVDKSRQAAPKKGEGEKLSIMIVGIDSLSHLNFRRQMKKTAAFIDNNLSFVELWGYNKIADNTYPNMMGVLTGLDETELQLSCLTAGEYHNHFDNCSLIWKRFKEFNYTTVYAEDMAEVALFHYWQEGFVKPPTDYYFRPLVRELEAIRRHYYGYRCLDGRRAIDVLLDFTMKMIPQYMAHDFFSFLWSTSMTHEDFNWGSLIDEDYAKLLQIFHSQGIFNKTLVLFMSDHGMRWGSFRNTYQGMMEERQPLMMFLYPPWMRKKYSKALENLELNAHHLTTPFDIHATLFDLLNVKNLENSRIVQRTVDLQDSVDTDNMPRGISLFLPVPDKRTCQNAGIASHWCTCHHRQELVTSEARVQRAARYVVRLINDRLKAQPQCRTLYLNSILEATVATPHLNIIKELDNANYEIDIMVRLETKPGLAVFESTVRMSQFSVVLTGTISRLNLYGTQSFCTDDYYLKMFCYCFR